jgi:serine/threonine-protein kinase
MSQTSVKGYQIVESIGRGASSEVFKARRIRDGQWVALKVVRRGAAESGRHFRQIYNEYAVASAWEHPNLVRLYGLVTSRLIFLKLQVALAMEYVPGRMMKGAAGLTTKQFIENYIQLADGLGYMHQHGYIHLDMKPHNVMVTPDGQAKVMDFGLCTKNGRYNPRVQGTPDFMAPEQLRKGWVDERTDVFNLGATMFYVLTGKPVHMTLVHSVRQNGHASVTSETFQSMSVEAPPELESLILQSCRPSPAERPATMARVKERLEAIRAKLAKT